MSYSPSSQSGDKTTSREEFEWLAIAPVRADEETKLHWTGGSEGGEN